MRRLSVSVVSMVLAAAGLGALADGDVQVIEVCPPFTTTRVTGDERDE